MLSGNHLRAFHSFVYARRLKIIFLSFVCAHLTAFEEKLANRIADYNHIVGTLLFLPISPESKTPSTIYSTSHLFFLGDLNFRIEIPKSNPFASLHKRPDFAQVLNDEKVREELKEFDQLLVQQRKGNVLVGLHEGEFWKFKCSYKYLLGEVDKYRLVDQLLDDVWHSSYSFFFSAKRTPSWTDRVLYATHTDSHDTPSNITNILYTSIPSYTTSDHVCSFC